MPSQIRIESILYICTFYIIENSKFYYLLITIFLIYNLFIKHIIPRYYVIYYIVPPPESFLSAATIWIINI